MWTSRTVALVILLASSLSAAADTVTTSNGGDSFTAGNTVTQTYDAAGDVFAAGEVVTTAGLAAGDVHIAGMDVNVATDTGADLYAMGATLTINASVTEDVTAMGYSIRLATDSRVGRNARLIGRSVVIDGQIAGALSAAGTEVTLNAPVAGDVRISADRIIFGPDARIDGVLTYASPNPINVPERVIAADRVRYEAFDGRATWREMRESWDDFEMPVLPTFISLLSAFLITLAFFVVIGAFFLTLTPTPIRSMRREIVDRPGHVFLLGVLGLSMLFGLAPITALTIVGIPFVPFAILFIIIAWTLGYVLAAYAIAMRLLAMAGGPADPPLLMRLFVLAAAVCVVTLLNFIPFVGWVINYTLVLLGIGAMTSALFNWLIGNPGYALDVDMKPIDT